MHTSVETDKHVQIASAYCLEAWHRALTGQARTTCICLLSWDMLKQYSVFLTTFTLSLSLSWLTISVPAFINQIINFINTTFLLVAIFCYTTQGYIFDKGENKLSTRELHILYSSRKQTYVFFFWIAITHCWNIFPSWRIFQLLRDTLAIVGQCHYVLFLLKSLLCKAILVFRKFIEMFRHRSITWFSVWLAK